MHGPGTELKKLLSWFAVPSDDCDCQTFADHMDDLGPDNCELNIEEITDHLIEEATHRNLPHGTFSRIIATQLVRTAIKRSRAQ